MENEMLNQIRGGFTDKDEGGEYVIVMLEGKPYKVYINGYIEPVYDM